MRRLLLNITRKARPGNTARHNIVRPSLAATLDRTPVSDRKNTMVLTETAISLDLDSKLWL